MRPPRHSPYFSAIGPGLGLNPGKERVDSPPYTQGGLCGMLQDVQSLSAATASVAFVLAFLAAWFEPAKRTPGTLLGLVALAVLCYAAGHSTIDAFIAPAGVFVVSGNPSVLELAGLLVAGAGVLTYSRRPVSVTLPETPMRRILETKALDLHNARNITESMLRSALGAKIVMRAEQTPSGPAFTVTMVNGAIEQLFGAPASKIVGSRLERYCPAHLYPWLSGIASESMATSLPCQDERRFDGKHTQWYELRAVAFPTGVTMTIADITDRRRIEDALRREAHTDPLTGLANRTQLKATLAKFVHRAAMKPGRGLALYYLDFDRFKVINDSLGHDVGDELLCSIADRLREALRGRQHTRMESLAARLGGDEFVLLIEGLSDETEARDFALSLVDCFRQPHAIREHTIVSTASVGLVVDEGQYKRAEDMLRDADMAMYAAKDAGKGRYVVFDQSLRERALSAATLEADLREAVKNGEFEVAFQPIIDLRSGQVNSFESLIRWNHRVRGNVCPDLFIPLAEELGLIEQIGEFVLRTACTAAKMMQEVVTDGRTITVAVNHSKRELLSGRFVEKMADILAESGIRPSLIKVEVTESICVKHQSAVVPVLKGLRALGVQTVVDDFGTGDSSFSCIEQFPLDQIKIDKRFLQSGRDEATRRAILCTMIEMSQSLGVPAVAEGIETREELDLLLELGCDLGQGWVFAEAMGLPEALELSASGLSRWIENLPLLDAISRNASRRHQRREAA